MSDNDQFLPFGRYGLVGILTAVLVAMKLTGKTNASWFMVLAPIWISFLVLACFYGYLIFLQ